jgi:aldehyde dehydrogenase (NAD+)
MSLATPSPTRPIAPDAVPDLVARLRSGFESGRTRPADWRLEQLGRLRALLKENAEALERALAADLRKPDPEGYLTDISYTISEVDLARKGCGAG